ncbi:GntR family transcriptional regulator [Streptomyces sp. G-G2]|uniref:GntR family transcriptional regulator n=1 Tax=Streptomyces sp. G-G2 TaxID=3046201 RepID=UPI0024B88235|nr:GntR family transcriptional regulator [Streptomyces sp. G-G2]MDJ0385152.1 GntR family transcriptional regulator [Streptomyces sp. G-G2]
MSSPSRGGGPAVTPKYQRIAAALRHELERTAHAPGARLPSERTLAARYQVNRQTIRAALQHLREDGLVVTGRRGTRPAAHPPRTRPAPGPAAGPDAGPGAGPGAGSGQNWLTYVTVAPSLAALLSLRGGDRTLVHHHRALAPTGAVQQHAVTYLSPAVVDGTPELAGYRERAATMVRDEDLRPLHQWLEHVSATARTAETITMTRTTQPSAPALACGLSVRRTLHDPAGRLLTVTDLAYPTWDRLIFHRDRPSPGFFIN